MKKTQYLSAPIILVIIMGILLYMLSTSPPTKAVLDVQCEPVVNVVEKRQSETFIVKVTFKNTGDLNGTWTVNVAFEGESNWGWTGTPQTLALKPSEKATLTWTGKVPEDAAVGSVARLIVYFDDKFVPQNWWIHVLAGAQLKIVSSEVS